MNKRQKIIVSIVGITIVLLALLGITYAYYLTRIEGNTNTNSISITTADLKLEYSDGNGIVEKANFMPGESITKTFSVENTGENKVTGYTIVLEDVVNELSRREDLKYSLYCTLDNGTSCGKSEDNLYPKTKNIAIIYANDIESKVKHNYELIVNYTYLDDIDQSDDMGSTISSKVNIYDAKDERLNPFSTGVSATDNKSLAYNIIENARLGKNGTTLTGTPLSKPAEEVSLGGYGKNIPIIFSGVKNVNPSNTFTYASDFTINENGTFTLIDPKTTVYSEGYELLKGKYVVSSSGSSSSTTANSTNLSALYLINQNNVTSSSLSYSKLNNYISGENILTTAQDDYGLSYYYRGDVADNYLSFANMCWRIVRIQGDGSIKLILEDQNEVCSREMLGDWDLGISNYGYSTVSDTFVINYLNPTGDQDVAMSTKFKNFQSDKLSDYLDYLKIGDWCLDDIAYTRIGASSPYEYTLLTEAAKTEIKNSAGTLYYDPFVRLSGNNKYGYLPTLKCNGTMLNKWGDNTTDMYVGALTADEIVYAGLKLNENGKTCYLVGEYQYTNGLTWITLSPEEFKYEDSIYVVSVWTKIFADLANSTISHARPAIILKAGTTITTGDGTIDNPYVVE